jgi:hypothetical protein
MDIDWFIYCVFDPDGLGQDFAYTDGLWRHGSPELHIWARPPDGADPGADWCWSDRDMMFLLNRAGQQQLSGALDLGDTWAMQVGGGLTTVEFSVTDGGVAPDLDTFQLDDGTPVRALRWSLHRVSPALDR